MRNQKDDSHGAIKLYKGYRIIFVPKRKKWISIKGYLCCWYNTLAEAIEDIDWRVK